MKTRYLALVLVLASQAACSKTSDIGKLQEEATEVVGLERPVYDELDSQEKALQALGSNMTQNANLKDAGERLGEARGALNQILATLSAAPVEVDKAVKSGVADNVVAVIDRMRAIFAHDEVIARADITTVEAWMIDRGALAGPLALH